MNTRESAHAAYAAATTPGDIRALALADLFFLMVYLLGRKDMDNDFCFDRCREVGYRPDGYLDLWAREHYKSTIITVGKTIQDILRDPNITVGIFSHTRPIAKSFLRQIMRELESNQALKDLFPDVLYQSPSKDAPKWSEEGGIIVRRDTNPKESTVEAWGLVEGQPTGKHFSLLIYDDVVTRESVSTPEQIRKTTEAWELSLNLGAHGGRRRMIGTRYHHFDTWSAIIKRGAAIPRIYAATKDGTVHGDPVFLTREALDTKRRDQGPYIFSAQMLQNPTADGAQGFKREWLRSYDIGKHPKNSNIYMLCDPSGEKKKDSDYTVIWVVALGDDKNTYIVDGVRDRLNLTERTAALFRLHRKWNPAAVGYEQYGMQADIEHIRYVQEQESYRFTITPLGGSMPKNDRIRRLVPVFEQGRFYLPDKFYMTCTDGRHVDLATAFVEEEYAPFPVSGHDDMLDCASRILDPGFPARFPMAIGARVQANAVTNYDVLNWSGV